MTEPDLCIYSVKGDEQIRCASVFECIRLAGEYGRKHPENAPYFIGRYIQPEETPALLEADE